MNNLLPAPFIVAFILVVVQTYLFVYFSLYFLRLLKLLKRPLGGMDYVEMLPAAAILLGIILISSCDVTAIFQSAKSYGDSNTSVGESQLVFFARSFTIILVFNVLFLTFNLLNIRFLFRGHFAAPSLPVSILLCSITIGLTAVFWFTCKELIDNITPKIINFR